MLPLSLTKKAIASVNEQGRPAMFYIHPWEVDPRQPRISGASAKSRFRHYTGLRTCERKLDKLLASSCFSTLSDVQLKHRESTDEPVVSLRQSGQATQASI